MGALAIRHTATKQITKRIRSLRVVRQGHDSPSLYDMRASFTGTMTNPLFRMTDGEMRQLNAATMLVLLQELSDQFDRTCEQGVARMIATELSRIPGADTVASLECALMDIPIFTAYALMNALVVTKEAPTVPIVYYIARELLWMVDEVVARGTNALNMAR